MPHTQRLLVCVAAVLVASSCHVNNVTAGKSSPPEARKIAPGDGGGTRAAGCPASGFNCHVGSGFVADEGICQYTPLECPPTEACLNGRCITSPVQLRVMQPDRPFHLADPDPFDGLPAHFTAELVNVSRSPITVSSEIETTISTRKLSRDGREVVPRLSLVKFKQDPLLTAERSLIEIAPMSSVTLLIGSLSLLNTVDYAEAFVAPRYPAEAGHYKVVFQYIYQGRDRGHANVFRGVVRSNEVAFDVL